MIAKCIDFYNGFEGEKEIKLYGMETLSIWDGYFTPIMQALFNIEIAEKGSAWGIIKEWQTCTGWCDIFSEKTKIQNLDDEINIFSKFNIIHLENTEYNDISDDWRQKILEVNHAILQLFSNAKENNCEVFIEAC